MNPNEPQSSGQAPSTQPQVFPQQPMPSTPYPVVNTPQNNPNNFDFILNPAQPAKKPPLGGNNALKLLVVVGGVVVLLVLVLFVVFSLLKPKTPTTDVVNIIQRQEEVIRLASLGESEAKTEDMKGLSYSIDLSVSTNQDQAQAYLKAMGGEISEEQLGLKRNATTDKLLEDAKVTSTYDTALRGVYETELTKYLNELQTAYKATGSAKLKTILSNSFDAGKMLLEQAQATPGA